MSKRLGEIMGIEEEEKLNPYCRIIKNIPDNGLSFFIGEYAERSLYEDLVNKEVMEKTEIKDYSVKYKLTEKGKGIKSELDGLDAILEEQVT